MQAHGNVLNVSTFNPCLGMESAADLDHDGEVGLSACLTVGDAREGSAQLEQSHRVRKSKSNSVRTTQFVEDAVGPLYFWV